MWSLTTDHPSQSTAAPAYWGGFVYFGDNGGFLYAANLTTGNLIWKMTVGYTRYCSRAADEVN